MMNVDPKCLKKSRVMAVRMPPDCAEKLKALGGPSPSTSAYLILSTVLMHYGDRPLNEVIRHLSRNRLTEPFEADGDDGRKQHLRAALRVISDAETDADPARKQAAAGP
jgi:hypothetical protein